ncbi:MAG: J domain-containing protein [Chromatiaceae bacterium]|nr:MAG: J domain-containing protein [Chromatiaceae bacterium]
MQYKDYYAALGVGRDASTEEIKRAYRRLARQYHPDVSKAADAEARFKEINEAHAVLKDPTRRAEYDALGTGWRAGDEFRPGSSAGPASSQRPGAGQYEFSPEEAAAFSDFFSSLFGGRGAGHPGHAGADDLFSRRGADQAARVQITLEDAYRGATRQLRLEVPEIGADGRMGMRARTLNVRIPAGITEGQQIRLAGQGGPGLGGKGEPGDLYLEVTFAPHPQFRSEGRDIHLRLPLAPWEAALGATVPVSTLGGTVNLRIPANAQGNQRLRLKGRGLPGSGSGSGQPAGDCIVQLEIVNPPADTAADRQVWQDLAARFPGFDPRAGFRG